MIPLAPSSAIVNAVVIVSVIPISTHTITATATRSPRRLARSAATGRRSRRKCCRHENAQISTMKPSGAVQ